MYALFHARSMNILVHWLLATSALIVSAFLIPGVHVESLLSALAAAVVLGFLNIFIKPILIILTLPVTVLTLGLFTLVINALLILLASAVVPGFRVDGFWWAVLFSIVLALVNVVFNRFE